MLRKLGDCRNSERTALVGGRLPSVRGRIGPRDPLRSVPPPLTVRRPLRRHVRCYRYWHRDCHRRRHCFADLLHDDNRSRCPVESLRRRYNPWRSTGRVPCRGATRKTAPTEDPAEPWRFQPSTLIVLYFGPLFAPSAPQRSSVSASGRVTRDYRAELARLRRQRDAHVAATRWPLASAQCRATGGNDVLREDRSGEGGIRTLEGALHPLPA
jgi:hypothetical protein